MHDGAAANMLAVDERAVDAFQILDEDESVLDAQPAVQPAHLGEGMRTVQPNERPRVVSE